MSASISAGPSSISASWIRLTNDLLSAEGPDHPGKRPGTRADETALPCSKTPWRDAGRDDRFVHGTTVGINTVIQRKGARACPADDRRISSDLLELGAAAHARGRTACSRDRPRRWCRATGSSASASACCADGAASIAARRAAAAARGARRRARRVSTASSSRFINAYRFPAHEREAAGSSHACCAGAVRFPLDRVWPVFREYERITTSAAERLRASAGSARYLDRFHRRRSPARRHRRRADGHQVERRHHDAPSSASPPACSMLLSGTASGVIGAACRRQRRRIATRSRSTSAAPAPMSPHASTAGRNLGDGRDDRRFPARLPSRRSSSIGDGGGSIAWVDRIRRASRSARRVPAPPGPGLLRPRRHTPTITDAFAVLRFPRPAASPMHRLRPDRDAARTAIGTSPTAIEPSIEKAAEAIVRIAIAGMYRRGPTTCRTVRCRTRVDFSAARLWRCRPLDPTRLPGARVRRDAASLVPMDPVRPSALGKPDRRSQIGFRQNRLR